MVSHELRFLFVHVQKTAGSTVDHLLEESVSDVEAVSGLAGRRHATWGEALSRTPEWADYWSFGFVRNPWARMYSWHAMILRRGAAARSGSVNLHRRIERSPLWRRTLEDYADFDRFVLRAHEEFPALRRPQLDYLTLGERQVDFIGRTESLESDLGIVFARLGLEPPEQVARTNSGPPVDYREFFSDAAREHVAQAFAPDIEAFDYSF